MGGGQWEEEELLVKRWGEGRRQQGSNRPLGDSKQEGYVVDVSGGGYRSGTDQM